MKPVISSLSALAAFVLITAPTASALTCSQQASVLQKQQAKLAERAEQRKVQAEEVELAGEEWQNAEAMRHFSDEDAKVADAKKGAYDALKTNFHFRDSLFQEQIAELNEDVEAYNAKCVKD